MILRVTERRRGRIPARKGLEEVCPEVDLEGSRIRVSEDLSSPDRAEGGWRALRVSHRSW